MAHCHTQVVYVRNDLKRTPAPAMANAMQHHHLSLSNIHRRRWQIL